MRRTMRKQENGLNPMALFIGIILGMIGGGLVALFRVPQSGKETRQQLKRRFQGDPIDAQIAQAKAEAHQRRLNWD